MSGFRFRSRYVIFAIFFLVPIAFFQNCNTTVDRNSDPVLNSGALKITYEVDWEEPGEQTVITTEGFPSSEETNYDCDFVSPKPIVTFPQSYPCAKYLPSDTIYDLKIINEKIYIAHSGGLSVTEDINPGSSIHWESPFKNYTNSNGLNVTSYLSNTSSVSKIWFDDEKIRLALGGNIMQYNSESDEFDSHLSSYNGITYQFYKNIVGRDGFYYIRTGRNIALIDESKDSALELFSTNNFNVKDMAFGSNDRLFFIEKDYVKIYDPASKTISESKISHPDIEGYIYLTKIEIDKNGDVYVLLSSKILLKLKEKDSGGFDISLVNTPSPEIQFNSENEAKIINFQVDAAGMLFLYTEDGIYTSNNGGESYLIFYPVDDLSSYTHTTALMKSHIYSDGNGNVVFFNGEKLFLSRNNEFSSGGAGVIILEPMKFSITNDLYVDSQSKIFQASYSKGVGVSADSGRSFKYLPELDGLRTQHIDGDSKGNLYFGEYFGNFYATSDGGVTIYKTQLGDSGDYVSALHVDTSGRIYVDVGQRLYLSKDKGRTFKQLYFPKTYVRSIFAASDGAVYIATYENTLYYSKNGETDFIDIAYQLGVDSEFGITVDNVYVSQANDLYVSLGRSNDTWGVYRQKNRVGKFEKIYNAAVRPIVHSDGTIYLYSPSGINWGVKYSTDDGVSFTTLRAKEGLPTFTTSGIPRKFKDGILIPNTAGIGFLRHPN